MISRWKRKKRKRKGDYNFIGFSFVVLPAWTSHCSYHDNDQGAPTTFIDLYEHCCLEKLEAQIFGHFSTLAQIWVLEVPA